MFTERQPMSGTSLRLVLVAIFGAAFAGWIWLEQASGGHVFDLFAAGYALLLVITFPSRLFSPLSFVHIYYGLWYVIALLFAQRYAGDVLDSPEMQLALGYLFLGYWICLLGCMTADQWLGNIRTVALKTAEPIGRNDEALSRAWIVLLYMVSTAMVALIVINSTLLLISHLRGALYNFINFFMLPFLAVVGYGLRAVSINHPSVQSHGFLQKTQTTG